MPTFLCLLGRCLQMNLEQLLNMNADVIEPFAIDRFANTI